MANGPQAPFNQMLDTAFSVFNSRDSAEELEKVKCSWQQDQSQAHLTAVTVSSALCPQVCPKVKQDRKAAVANVKSCDTGVENALA